MTSATAVAPPAASKALSPTGAYIVLVALVVIWGVNWPIMKVAVQSMPPLWFVVTRLTMGALCLFVFLIATGRLAKPTSADWPVGWSCPCTVLSPSMDAHRGSPQVTSLEADVMKTAGLMARRYSSW